MDRLPEKQLLVRPIDSRQRTFTISPQPRTWLAKVVFGIIGIVVLLASLFFFVVAFAVIASVVALASLYLLWRIRGMRRAVRKAYGVNDPHISRDL